MEKRERVKCLLCGVCLLSGDEQSRIEHICIDHNICELKEVKRLAGESFIKVTEKTA